ncbi:MAG: diguanylate cyclase [Alphaproteobacteria bacterium]
MIGKILIVDDVSTNRIVFKVKLTAAGYNTVMAATGSDCLRVTAHEMPDLILLDLKLPDLSGIEVLRRLKTNLMTRRIPVVMVSSEQDQGVRLAALQAGAEDFLNRPIDDQTLLARLRGLFRTREAVGGLSPMPQDLGLFGMAEPEAGFERPGHVALVMQRSEAAMHLRKQLASIGKEQISILTSDEVHADPVNRNWPDVYVIDADIGTPGGGLRVMSELLSRGESRHAAFCIYNRSSPNLVPAMAFDLGANDLVDQRISPSELAVRLRGLVRRKRDADQMRASVQDGLRLAMIDPLTGLHNRRYGLAQLNTIAARAAQDDTSFAVMVVDLDRFKAVNDRWGHAAGDQVLIELAGRLAATLRASDLLARIGGEEFLIALPDTTLHTAGIVAARLCEKVQATPTVLPDGTRINVTISIGMTVAGGETTDGAPVTVSDLVAEADRALMQSKSGGRNKVTVMTKAA